MAIFRLNKVILGRKQGGSAVLSSGYRHARAVTVDLTGETKSYEAKKSELVHEAILLPENAPAWAIDRYASGDVGEASERLWNDIEKRAEQHNYRKVAQLAGSYTIALPHELSRDAQIALIESYVRENLMPNGEIADIVIHDKGDGNPHAHIMTTLRALTPDGFGGRIGAGTTARLQLINERASWAAAANAALEAEGHEARIDHRSNVDRGIVLQPCNYSVEIAAEIEKAGGVYRSKARALNARAENERLLQEDPDHILVVLSQEKPLFVEEDIRFELRRKLPPEADLGVVERLAMRALASPELVAIGQLDYMKRPIYTTRTALEVARQLTRSALQMRDSSLDLTGVAADPALDERLSPQQREAVQAMISPRRIEVVEGYAGAGKTFALIEASRIWKERGFAVYGSAVSGKAVQEIAGLHGYTGTIAQMEQLWDAGALPPEGKFVMFLDEAGMVGTAVWARFQSRINAMGGKIIVTGDRAQLGPVADTSALMHVASLVGVTQITEIKRQADPLDRAAILSMSKGAEGVSVALEHFAQKGCVRASDSADTAISAIVDSYFADTDPDNFWSEGHQRIAIAHTNADVDVLNTKLQAKSVALGFASAKDEDSITISRSRENKAPIVLRVGDRIRFTRPHPEAGVSRSALGTVLWIADSTMSIAVDGRAAPVIVDTQAMSDFDLGYAITVHKSQGMSVKGKVSALITGLYDWHLMDVALSRHVDDLEIHIAARDFGVDLELASQSDVVKAVTARVSRSNLQAVVDADTAPTLRRAHPTMDEVWGAARPDRLPEVVASPDDQKTVRVSLTTDVHVFQAGQRIAGLLRGEFKEGDPLLGSDPKSYALDPKKVVDDLLAERGVIRAADVAIALAEVAKDPETFTRLYYSAMSHPDLVVLSEQGRNGEGRVYSTLELIDQATSVMDQSMRLAVRQSPFSTGMFVPETLAEYRDANGAPIRGGNRLARQLKVYHAIQSSASSADRSAVPVGAGVLAPHAFDLPRLQAEALAAKIATTSRERGFDPEQCSAMDMVLWPSRIAVIDAIGLDSGVQVMEAVGGVIGHDRIISLHQSRAVAEDAAAKVGGTAHSLHSLGADLKRGHLTLASDNLLFVPEASALAIDQIEVIMTLAEQHGAKLVLHNDPSIEGSGATLRHLAARLPVAHVGGLSAIAEERRGFLQEGEPLARAVHTFQARGQLVGAQSEKAQIAAFVEAYQSSEATQTLGLAASARVRATLNAEIEMACRLRDSLRDGTAFALDRGGYAPPLNLSIMSDVVVTRDLHDHKLQIGDRGKVISVAGSGDVTLRFGDREVTIVPGREASALDYGYVVSPYMARRAKMSVDHAMVFAGRGLTRQDLTTVLQLGSELTLCLPAEVEQPSASVAFIERVLNRAPRGSILDYGFDPAKALQAAGKSYDAPDLAQRLEQDAESRDVLARTKAAYRTAPEFILAELARKNGRFGIANVAQELRDYYSDTELDPTDRRDLATRLIETFSAKGVIINAGLSDMDGTQLYTTRVQAEIEFQALRKGQELATKFIEDLPPAESVDLRIQHIAGPQRLSLAFLSPRIDSHDSFFAELGRVWGARGYQVIATDMSANIAARQAKLMGERAEGLSWAALEAQWATGRLPANPSNTVLVVTGAERMPSGQWARIQARADAMGMKIIALAREHDLPRNNSINMFRALADEVGVYREASIPVQVREAERMASTLLSGSPEDAARAIAIHDGLGNIQASDDRQSAIKSIGRRFWSNGAAPDVARLAFAHSRANAERLDDAIRSEGLRLGHIGDEVQIGTWKANIGQQLLAISSPIPEVATRSFVTLLEATDTGIRVRAGDTGPVYEVPHSQAAWFNASFASTLWDATEVEVDASYLLATYGMDQPLFRLGLSRHRHDVEVHAARRDFRDVVSLQRAAGSRHSLESLRSEVAPVSGDIVHDPAIAARRDRTSPIFKAGPYALDSHLHSVAQRVAGLMAISYDPAQPVLGDDTHGYAADPRKVVDDILSQASVLRAEDVARTLSSIIRDPQTFERLFAEAMSHPDLVVLSEQGRNGEGRIYSTLTQIKQEIDINDRVVAMAMVPNGFNASESAITAAAVTPHGPMSPDQQHALRHATSGGRVTLIKGYAGSGKSTLLSGVRQVYEGEGWSVIGAAASGDAARSLQDSSGITSRTLHSLFSAAERQRAMFGPKTLLVVDEAAMLDARMYDRIVALAERTGVSLLFTGDDSQIQPYGAGAMFRSLSQRIGTTTLTKIWRQRDARDASASENLAKGLENAVEAIQHYAQRGMLIGTYAGTDKDTYLRSVVAGYVGDQSSQKVMLAFTRQDVAKLNALARTAEQQRRDSDLPDYVAQDAQGNQILLQAGDRVRIAERHYDYGLNKGESGEVVTVSIEAKTYTLQLGDGDERRFVTLPLENGPSLSYAYAQTIDTAQGISRQSVHAVLTPSMAHDRTYVALTRHIERLRIYTPVAQEEAIAFASRLVSRDARKVTTLEPEYGFDPHRIGEAVQLARADQTVLRDYLETHGVPRQQAPRTRLASLFKPDLTRETLAPAAGMRALGYVLDARTLQGDLVLDGALQQTVTRLLREVAHDTTWAPLASGLSRAERAATETNARQWTQTPESEVALPEARALARALAYAEKHQAHNIARALKSGIKLLNVTVEDARRTGRYDQLVKEAHAPVADIVPTIYEPVVQAPRRTKPSATPMRRSSFQLSLIPSEAAIARRVIDAFLAPSPGPGFFETLAKELAIPRDQSRREPAVIAAAQTDHAQSRVQDSAATKDIPIMPQDTLEDRVSKMIAQEIASLKIQGYSKAYISENGPEIEANIRKQLAPQPVPSFTPADVGMGGDIYDRAALSLAIADGLSRQKPDLDPKIVVRMANELRRSRAGQPLADPALEARARVDASRYASMRQKNTRLGRAAESLGIPYEG